MVRQPWSTPAALAWLQMLLQERLGHRFDLHLQSDGSRLAIALPGDVQCIFLKVDGAMFARTDSDLPYTEWNATAEGWRTALSGYLPVPGTASLALPLIRATESGWYIDYDILGLTYWMLNRIEEIGRTDLDHHGRFPATASHAYKYNYLERPVVDEWLHVLAQVISKTWPGLELKQHTFSIKVSHDVDRPSRYSFTSAGRLLRVMVGDVLKRGDFKNPIRAPWIRLSSRKKIHPTDPFNTFEWIMDISDGHGLTSAFYFICGRTSNLDADYEPEHPAIRALMHRIHERGHEIGLHPSYNTYQHPEMIADEAQRLRKIAAEEGIEQEQWGGRMHYLRWEQPTTLRAWAEAEMDYDSTLGYADRPGFRCGTCFEYPAFDPVSNEALKLIVRPLVVMECSVIEPCYAGLGKGTKAQEVIKQLKNACRAVEGCFTLLWHNSSLCDTADKELYLSVFR